ncbi:hypothetical protein HBI56_202560 [Parastagonospora nodorum]|nr:hypothetical protein HBH53_108770 [Parastagonospora nodorum]KAH3961896.1 hypothetical protein HBH51_178280 [Parastagonospora nodorum]KAH3970941.1 hypothetical protein HBH52_162770 [Parastagonospora nodorum]KAH3997972.1 hypothetical protein HBI10_137500 [Parastagonospora nodorum]KAH4020443.1 hypothetical protein HBI13_114950 [Parastagonospora nodorum]
MLSPPVLTDFNKDGAVSGRAQHPSPNQTSLKPDRHLDLQQWPRRKTKALRAQPCLALQEPQEHMQSGFNPT